MTHPSSYKPPFYDTVVDQIYARLEGENHSDRDSFLALMNPQEKAAMLVCWFDSQVNNGGIIQWHDNGYSDHAKELIDILEAIKDSDGVGQKLSDMLKNVLAVIDEERADMHSDEYDDDWAEQQIFIVCDPFDDYYYSVSDEFLSWADVYIQAIPQAAK